MPSVEEYRAPWWLPGGNAQTIVAPLFEWRRPVAYPQRTRWRTPDHDFVDIDWAGPADAPRLLVIFHGLEGNSQSHYARALVHQALADRGWRCAVVHFRSCSGEPNWKARAYHAGDSKEINWLLRRFAGDHPSVYPVGVSLGANALLKWLGLGGGRANDFVRRAAAVSAPFDMAEFGESMGKGFNKAYGWWFLRVEGMRNKALWKIQAFRDKAKALRINPERVGAACTLPEFEDSLTAPLHGFRDKEDYYKKASAAPWLAHIRVPTLLLNARNDPFMRPNAGTLPNTVKVDFQDQGGHAGFPGRNRWMARRVLEFLSQ